MADYRCSKCHRILDHIGVPAAIRMTQVYGQVADIGTERVPAEVKADPYLYKGFYCGACTNAFCPSCSNMQGEVCTGCGSRQLMPAYRPLLKNIPAETADNQLRRALILALVLGALVIILWFVVPD